MKKSPVSKRIGKKPMSLRERPTPRALAAAVIPTPQIMAPANGTVFGPGEAVRVHVSTNRPDLQSIVWLIAPDGTIVDKVAVTWPAAAPGDCHSGRAPGRERSFRFAGFFDPPAE